MEVTMNNIFNSYPEATPWLTSRAASRRRRDTLNAARGIVGAIGLGLVFWGGVLGAVVAAVWR
jgi:hypothetical protein